ncbi:hypothetical protein DFH08DRAFT_1008474 [Mycena albidolilacea]|uniref:Uncharacterized protein n=1 Tax=Mycena albidolilacea TaxID=1033008 RepID=A0AAD7EQI2_9AGAR|nr:hypothetical protein DFH08DRAFT_1008474 [Mycena albidolilacea]
MVSDAISDFPDVRMNTTREAFGWMDRHRRRVVALLRPSPRQKRQISKSKPALEMKTGSRPRVWLGPSAQNFGALVPGQVLILHSGTGHFAMDNIILSRKVINSGLLRQFITSGRLRPQLQIVPRFVGPNIDHKVQWSIKEIRAAIPARGFQRHIWLSLVHHSLSATMITYLHHTDPVIPHFRAKEWNFQRGATATRGIMSSIICRSINHGKEATEALKAFIGEYYTFSDKPVFQALWDSYNRCSFVDDEGRTRVVVEKGALDETGLSGDIVLYRDKKGQSVVKTGAQ